MRRVFNFVMTLMLLNLFFSCDNAKRELHVEKYANGNLKHKVWTVDGLPDGKEIFYYENGQLYFESEQKMGKMIGTANYYYSNGKIMMIVESSDDGDILNINAWDKEGNQVVTNGNGTFTTYYDNGNPEKSISYKDCKLHGKFIEWHPNGLKSKEINIIDGNPEGEGKMWDENGELIYDNGKIFPSSNTKERKLKNGN